MCLLTFFSCMNSEKQQDLHAGPGLHGGIGLCQITTAGAEQANLF